MASLLGIYGESSAGKSTSFRNLDPAKTLIINTDKKPLPIKRFKKNYNTENKNYIETSSIPTILTLINRFDINSPEYKKVENYNCCIIDTFGCLMTDNYFSDLNSEGANKFQKFVNLGKNAWSILNTIQSINNTKVLFIVTYHSDIAKNSNLKEYSTIKTIGNMTDKYVDLPSRHTYIAMAYKISDHNENKYLFRVKPSADTNVKIPLGVFPPDVIDVENDVNILIDAIQSFETT